MDEHTLRRRLEALNRAPINGTIREGPTPAAALPGRSVAASSSPPSSSPASANARSTRSIQRTDPSTSNRPISGLLQRGESMTTSCGEHWRVRLPLDSLWPGGIRLVSGRQEYLREQHSIAQQAVEPAAVMHPDFASFVAALPDRTLLLDLETCGLAGSALFLVGMLRQIEGAPTVELLLARNYAEEPAVLESFWQILAGYQVLVTFNGKAFDWPMVLERTIRHRHPSGHSGPQVHLDVLHHARRRWRRQLPDCRLKTLERYVCRRERDADIPGHRIPSVYAEFVRTGFERDMEAVLYHNAVDLVTLLDITLRLAG